MKKYQLVQAESLPQLEQYVNNEITHGWKVTGGLAVVMVSERDILRNARPVFLQAMIHEEGNDV